MAIVSLMMQPSWQNYIDDLSTLFIRDQSAEVLEDWKNSDFTERIRFCMERDILPRNSSWVEEAISRSHCLSTKCAQTAEEYRQEGNKKFQRKLYRPALEDYTFSIRYSPISNVSLAYANRSAALFHLEEYKYCILDIRRALDADYPGALRHKLYYRRSQAYSKLSYYNAAKTDLNEAISCLEEAELDEKRKDKLLLDMQTDLNTLCDSAQTNGPASKLSEPIIDLHPTPVTPVVTGENNSYLIQASSHVTMQTSETNGRHLVADTECKPGDVLIVERPYAAVLLPSNYTTHCHHCLTKATVTIPCLQCPLALYCTESCRDASWDSYHCLECPYLGLMHAIGIAHLAFRIVIVSGLKSLLEFKQTLDEDENRPSRVYEFGYKSVYNLLHHTEKMNTEDLVQYTLGAIFLLKLLQKTDFFTPSNQEHPSSVSTPHNSVIENLPLSGDDSTNGRDCKTSDNLESHYYIGGLLLRHIQQLVCNAHAVSDLAVSSSNDRNEKVFNMSDERLATAIYPTASLMNHSCEPNILSSFLNDTLVVRCTKTIKKGAQVYNCYGPHCKRMSRAVRQQALKQQYFFDCQCTECSIPMIGLERYKALKCPKCSGPLPIPDIGSDCSLCIECGTDYSKAVIGNILAMASEGQEAMMRGMKAADDGNLKDAKEYLKQCLRIQKDVLYKEHEDMAAVSDQMARIYSLEENYRKAAPYVEYSIKVLGRIHGYDSVEYGLEVKKLAQIQFNALMVDKCRLNVHKAIEILQPRLGREDDMVEELCQMRKCLG